MLKLALILALQMSNTHTTPRYSLAQLSQAMEVPPRLQLPEPQAARAPTPAPAPTPARAALLDKTPSLYTVKAFERDLQSKACQCITLMISPEGNVLGTSKPCSCDEWRERTQP